MQRVFRTGAAARWWVGLVCIAVLGVGAGCGTEGGAAGDDPALPGATGVGASAPGAGASGTAQAPGAAVTQPVPGQATTPGLGAGAATAVPGAATDIAAAGGTAGVMMGGEFPEPAAPAGPTGTAGGGDFCGVLTAVQAKCGNCHGAETKFGAPMSLVTHEDFTKPSVLDPSRTVAAAVKARIHDMQRPMPPAGTMELTPEEMATIDAWVDAGAPAPAGECAAPAEGSGELVPGQEIPDQPFPECDDIFEIRASGDTGQPQTIRGGAEVHPKVTMDAPWGDKDAWVIGWHPITDNDKVLHHWILYQGGGFGGKFLIGWAYGQGGANTPEDVGIFVPKGSRALMLDIHYYNVGNSASENDDSGLEVCVTYTKPTYVATTIGLTGDALAPAMQRVENATECTAEVTGEVHLMTVAPHMHKLGVHGKLEVIRGGETIVLHDGPFQFGDQKLYPLDFIVQDGDVLRTTCTYQNDTPFTVTFGQNSDNEMCFNFVEYYPMGNLRCGAFSL